MNPIRKKGSGDLPASLAKRSSNGTRIFVKAKTGQKEERVVAPPPRLLGEAEEDFYIVWTKERPIESRANEAIARLLAKHFKVSRSQVKLVSGAISKRKAFEIIY